MTQATNTTGKLIAHFRHNLKMKQENLAQELGISQSLLSDYENDKISPTVVQLSKIASALQIDPASLIPESMGSHYYYNFNDHAFVIHGVNNIESSSMMEEYLKVNKEILAVKDESIAFLKTEISKKDSLIEKLLQQK